MILKTGFFIIIILTTSTRSFGQNGAFYSKKIDMLQNPKPEFQTPKFKITFSDPWFGRDKVHHFLTSALLSGVGYYFLREEQSYSNKFSQQGGFGFSISLGLAKEIRDGFKIQNAFSVKDLIADILGTLVGIAIVSDL